MGRTSEVVGGAMRTKLSRVNPLYHQVYVQLRQFLMEGTVDPQKPLPSEPALAARFGVSRVTIRKTLEHLQKEGLIVRLHGRGTFPAPSIGKRDKTNISSVLDNLLSIEKRTTAVTIEWSDITADERLAQELGTQDCIRIRRIRSMDGKPLSLTTLHVPYPFASALDRETASDEPVVRLLESRGIIAERAEQAITAIMADEEAAQALAVAVGSPLILMRRLMFDAEQVPVLRQESAYPPDRFEYRMTLSRQSVGPVAQWTPIA
ncbi:MAG: GntR family transcriptional regulator [Aliihoeflea sp.]|jgi:GntR family transcriptional regulator